MVLKIMFNCDRCKDLWQFTVPVQLHCSQKQWVPFFLGVELQMTAEVLNLEAGEDVKGKPE